MKKLALLSLLPLFACANETTRLPTVELGTPDGKADSVTCMDIELAEDEVQPVDFDSKIFQATLTIASGKARLVSDGVKGEAAADVATVERVAFAKRSYTVDVENTGTTALEGELCIRHFVPPVTVAVMKAAHKNLERVSAEIDARDHLSKYELTGSIADEFLLAVLIEYAEDEPQLEARLSALASMVFFAAPDVLPPSAGKLTPFHGLDMDDFEALYALEDDVWRALEDKNGGSKIGVRPFSVCETTFMIEKYVEPGKAWDGFDAYKAAYEDYAEDCPAKDLAEWYNFRGLGHLRPSWVESNIMERVLRRMVGQCRSPDAEWADQCAEWNESRRAYREETNLEMASRFFFYEPGDQEDHFAEPSEDLVLLEDYDGDGVGEFIRPGEAKLQSGETVTLSIDSTGQFSGRMQARYSNGDTKFVGPNDLELETATHSKFTESWLTRNDLGLSTLFSAQQDCASDDPQPSTCSLLKRFYVLIDRHEDFYQTYSSLYPDCRGQSWCLSSQPSPLVACSVTLGAAHEWDDAGIPSGGTAGFIFLMRIPFADILVGDTANVSTLDDGPNVLSIRELYETSQKIDFSKVWLDIASLSNDLYANENEISKFGGVPAEQIEGILVVREPTRLDDVE